MARQRELGYDYRSLSVRQQAKSLPDDLLWVGGKVDVIKGRLS